jgi:hypothetical protein
MDETIALTPDDINIVKLAVLILARGETLSLVRGEEGVTVMVDSQGWPKAKHDRFLKWVNSIAEHVEHHEQSTH